MMEVKGAENEYQALKEVPHGKIEKVYYKSTALEGVTRRLHVYLPPNYEQISKKQKLPVLYLLHGGGDNDASWTTAGRANLILDNLYAEGKLQPMIVVMPAGHTHIQGFFMGAGDQQDPFCRDFIQDIVPFVERNYPVSVKREHRAIAGLSMGGIQTINLALWNPDLFGYVFPMSTGYFPNDIKTIDEKYVSVLTNPSVNKFNRFMIAIGKDDFANTNNKNMMELFKKHGVKFEYYETEGAHTFLFWRKHLAYFSPMLFR